LRCAQAALISAKIQAGGQRVAGHPLGSGNIDAVARRAGDRDRDVLLSGAVGRELVRLAVLPAAPPEAIAVAWSAQRRLHRTWTRLEARGKRRTIVAVAAARELAGFAWAITQIE
jgi:hypothetical protein